MMKKILLQILCFTVLFTSAFAQDRTVNGTVTDKADGQPLPGVSVKVKGTQTGSVTDANGKYQIKAASGSILTFTYIGYATMDSPVGSSSSLNISLTTDSKQLGEVVVTALGISREKRSVGYALQAVKGDDLSQTKQTDLNTALAGKVAGVQFLGGSGAKFGNSTIRIRGVNNLSGGNPIYVVNGTIVTDASAINNDDIESLSVLKGPAATALYGQRGSEGAVVIQLKKGKKDNGIGIDFNQSTQFENVYTLPRYQNEYGGGSSQEWNIFEYDPTTDPSYLALLNGAKYYDYNYDESWGPRMDGTMYAPWYAWDPAHPGFGQIKSFTPQPNNVRDFYVTGVTSNTNIAFSKTSDIFNSRVSFTNLYRKGITPNSDQKKYFLSTDLGFNVTPKLTISTNLNFTSEALDNVPQEGYGTQTGASFNQWFHRDLEIDQLKFYKRPDGTYTSWNINDPRDVSPKFWDNPYTEVYANLSKRTNQRFFGNVTANYKFTNYLSASLIARGNYFDRAQDSRVATGTVNTPDSYQTLQYYARENNYVASLDFNKKFGDYSLTASAFGETRQNYSNYLNQATAGGLAVPDLYNISASVDRPTAENRFENRSVRSVYGFVSAGYKDFLYLDANIRNDWSSTLPQGNNSYLYGGLSGSFIFSHFIPQNNILSFGKLRASIARVGTDTSPYSVAQTYSVGNPYGSFPILSVPNQIPNGGLRPTISNSFEIGTELHFLKERLSFDFNYYNRDATDQIIPITIPGTTGFNTALINAGKINNHGYEFTLGGTPIKTENVIWNLNANISFNRNKVIQLYQDLENLQVSLDGGSALATGQPINNSSFGFVGSPRISNNAFKGQPFGQLIGPGYVDDASGQHVIDSDPDSPTYGSYLVQDNKLLGSTLPKYTGGFTTQVSYKGITLGGSMDFAVGGRFMSISSMFGGGSGLTEETAGLNDKGFPKRDPVANGGGVKLPGVKQDGTPNDIYVDAQTLYESSLFSFYDYYTYDRTYVKLREISLGYSIPKKYYQNVPFRNITVTLVAQNPWLIYTGKKGIDPSQLEDSWYEGGQLPSTRSFGFNLKCSL